MPIVGEEGGGAGVEEEALVGAAFAGDSGGEEGFEGGEAFEGEGEVGAGEADDGGSVDGVDADVEERGGEDVGHKGER